MSIAPRERALFVRSAKDIHDTRKLLIAAGSHAGIVAKIERVEAVKVLDEIIQSADAVMDRFSRIITILGLAYTLLPFPFKIIYYISQ